MVARPARRFGAVGRFSRRQQLRHTLAGSKAVFRFGRQLIAGRDCGEQELRSRNGSQVGAVPALFSEE